jgi:hypothetical protein
MTQRDETSTASGARYQRRDVPRPTAWSNLTSAILPAISVTVVDALPIDFQIGGSMKQNLFIGDRIQISTLGASRCPRLAGRTGTIVGLSIYANSVSVRLDGNKSRSTFHRDYLQVILAAAEPIRSPCACRR